MRHRRLPGALLLALLVAIGTPSRADIHMDKAHLKPKPFKIYDGHLTAQQKTCLQYALKQWVYYDEAPIADAGANRNESNDHVMAAGKQHNMKDAKDHARSSRSMSAGERDLLKKTYGNTSPFKGGGDPTKPEGAGWFTSDEGAADVSIEPTSTVPTGGDNTLGWMQYGTTVENDVVNKGGLSSSLPAALWIREPPADGKTWCYPTDTDGDGYITNKDAKCPTGTVDWYAVIKHELGHYFSFIHDDMNHFDAEFPPPVWDPAQSLCFRAMSPANDEAPCVDAGSEFSQRAGRIFFSSNRVGGFGGRDLWFATWDPVLAAWAMPTNCGPNVNTAFDETDPAPALGGALLYFASNRTGQFDLYLARTTGTASWDSVTALPAGINTPYDETGPCEAWDRLFFASNRPGGIGGFDLYAAAVDTAHNMLWLPPANLGSFVNSPANERDPDVTVDEGDSLTVLVFASDRVGGLSGQAAGGYDLYRSQENMSAWGSAANLGSPVNTSFNETSPSHGLGNSLLYFASDRSGGHGGWDVFECHNLLPRPLVAWNGDATGAAGTLAQVEFEVLNRGLSPAQLFPHAMDDQGWGLNFNPNPLVVGPGQSVAFPIDVSIPPGAPDGASDEIVLQVQGPSVNVSSNHAYVSVPGAAGVEGPREAHTFVRGLPNPFRESTRISYGLAAAADVRIEIFDVAGRRLRALRSGREEAGTHSLEWDGRGDDGRMLTGGVFLCRLVAAGEERRTMLVRVR
jgi:hypothetical protein